MKTENLIDGVLYVCFLVAGLILGAMVGVHAGIESEKDLISRKTKEAVETVSFGIVEGEDEYAGYKQIWFQHGEDEYRIVLPIKVTE